MKPERIMKPYQAKNGRIQYKPSLAQVQRMMDASKGWCLNCGKQQDGVEPDARRYTCDKCGEAKVYGPEELALMGLVH